MALLNAADLIAGYSAEVNVLNGINLAVEKGDIVTVIGPNGAGKSTLMKVLCGLISPVPAPSGLDGDDITGHSAHSVVRSGSATSAAEQRVPGLDRRRESRGRLHRDPWAEGTGRPRLDVRALSASARAATATCGHAVRW